MEQFFGPRMDAVRIHTNADAARSAAAVNARAYTVGRDIVFAAGQYQPTSAAGTWLLAHELAHVTQQQSSSGPSDGLVLGAVGDPAEREAAAAAASVAAAERPEVRAVSPAATVRRQVGVSRGEEADLDDEPESVQLAAAPAVRPIGVCGPKVTRQFRRALGRIETTFGGWSRRNQLRACRQILIPVTADLQPDINGWDMLPLFQGYSRWLRTRPVYSAARRGPCATPTSSDPKNRSPFAAGHEDPATCSNTVEFEGACWLNGTVNYGTFGVMVRLCEDEFTLAELVRSKSQQLEVPSEVVNVLELSDLTSMPLVEWAEILIRGYKAFKGTATDTADLPLAWMRAFYRGGSSASPPGGANRPRCRPTCPVTGEHVTWSWVWEPVNPRP
jgi:hypothetical protein